MDEQLKKRLIGAIVLISLAVIFLPMLLEHEPVELEHVRMKPIPPAPEITFTPPPEAVAVTLPAPEVVHEPKVVPEPIKKPVAEVKQPVKVAKPIPGIKKPAKVATPAAWIVQVGSYSNKQSAIGLVKKLRKAGLDTMDVTSVKINGKTLYRVRVGPEINKDHALKLKPKIKKLTGSEGKVLVYP